MKKPLKLYLMLFLVLVAMLTMATFIYGFAKQQLYKQEIVSQQKQMHETMHSLISEQQNNVITLALSLTENPLVQQMLINTSSSDFNHRRLSVLVNRINQQAGFEGFWLQLIDLEGDSVYRSWTENVGDNLSQVRPEIQEFLIDPKPTKVISVGRFTISFKSMIPMFDEQFGLLGIVEMITQFTPLTNELLSEQGVESVVLVDKSYRKQLTKVASGDFVNNYLANNDARPELIELLKNQDVDALINSEGYIELDNYVVSSLMLKDESGNALAHWFTFAAKDKISFEQASWVLQKYLIINIAAILLLLLLTLQFINNRQANREKRYFRQIIDSVSDIVYITDLNRIVDSNRHFFEFYDEFTSIEDFLKKYNCVCDTFENEPGFIQETVEGEYWIDYILKRPYQSHQAKVIRHGKTIFFQLKIRPMQGTNGQLFNVLMQDITCLEEFKERLQQLTVTDELTGVGNRLACNQSLHAEIERAHRYKINFSVIMLDIDYFKLVNDEFGHDVGDIVLKVVASTIKGSLRDIDHVCRYGGEEFLILLPESDKEAAKKTAERLREAVSGLPSTEVPTPITISLGVASLRNWDTDLTFVKRADEALYRAKEGGRNRVEVDDEQAVVSLDS